MNRLTLSRCFVLVATISSASLASAERSTELSKRLKDSSPTVRKQAALTLVEANDAEAVPVLIDLLTELSAEERRSVEEALNKLAGEWAPTGPLEREDKIARKIHRDAWMMWWQDTDGPALLGLIREHTLTPELRRTVKQRIDKLGDDDYRTREAGSMELRALGRVALPQLREARKDRDPEVARRARYLISSIEREKSLTLPGAALRLLALRKPPGTTEALLAYLPLAEEENLTAEVKKSLALLANQDGKLDAAVVRALADDLPLLRAVSAEALLQSGGKDGRALVRRLLKDKDPSVRLRVGLGLALNGEREAVPVLIDLLAAAPDDEIGQVEDVLLQLAGEAAPALPWGTEAAEKTKCRDAWAAWWKANGERVELARLVERPWFGYTLLCDSSRNRVFEIDRNGKERWAIENVPFPVDAWVIGGNRVLIAEYMGRKISERDLQGHVLWSKSLSSQPVNVQRLANGHTFIATLNSIHEVDRAGGAVYSINNIAGGVTAAYRGRDGRIVCLAQSGSQCILMDTNGTRLKQFPSNRDGAWTSGIDLLPNGHILVTQPNHNKVTEFDRSGKPVVEVSAPLATTATALPNGHFLIASSASRRAFEVDRGGKVVWEYQAGGSIFRARRR